MNTRELQLLLEAAGRAHIGLLIRTNNPEALRQRLYAARAASGAPEWAGLQFRISPFPEGQLVICKAGASSAAPRPRGPKSVPKSVPMAVPMDFDEAAEAAAEESGL